MTHLEIPIIKRRQLRPMALLTGFLAMGLLGYYVYVYIQRGKVPVLDELVRLLGLDGFSNWFYLGTLAVLLILIIPFLQTVLKQKKVKNGLLILDNDRMGIKEGDGFYQLCPKELEQIKLEVLSEENLEKRRKLGGNFIKISTPKGLFRCEFHLTGRDQRDVFLARIKFLQDGKTD